MNLVVEPFCRKNGIQSGSFSWNRTKNRVEKATSGKRKMSFGYEIPAEISVFEVPGSGEENVQN